MLTTPPLPRASTPTPDQTLALLSLPINQLKRFASLTPEQQRSLLNLSSGPPPAHPTFFTSKRRTSVSHTPSPLSHTPSSSAALSAKGNTKLCPASHTAPTSPSAHSPSPMFALPPSHPSAPVGAWAATYSLHPQPEPLPTPALSLATTEPDASSAPLYSASDVKGTSSPTSTPPHSVPTSPHAPPVLTYVNRLSIDTHSTPSSPSPRTPPAVLSPCLASPANDNRFRLKLSLPAATDPDSPSSPPLVLPSRPLPFISELQTVTKGRHRKGQQSYELTEGGTLFAGGYEINSKGIMRTPGLRPSISGGQGGALLAAISPVHRGSVDGVVVESPVTADADSASPSLSPANGSVSLGMELQLSDLVRLSELGAGASGTVVKALHVPSLKLVALKTVSVFDKQDRHQLVKELNAFSTATGAHILEFVGACFSEGSCTMALELMNRGSLEQLVQRHGAVKNEIFLQSMMGQVLRGLSDLAKLHCVHRDIKLANLLMRADGVVKISDFGLLRQLDGTQDMCNTFLGTMAFLSPERITGDQYTTKSDIWSVGISVVYLVKGRLVMPTEYWSLLSVVNGAAPCLTPEDGASELLCDFVKKMLHKDPAERWSADQLLAHPFMTTALPENHTHSPWPVTAWTQPDPMELSTIVEAVVGTYYPTSAETGHFAISPEDDARFRHLAAQLGCDPAVVTAAFLDRLCPPASPTGTSISYAPHSSAHSRLPSVTITTMADGRRSRAGSIGQTAAALSTTLTNAMSMSGRIKAEMGGGEGRPLVSVMKGRTIKEPLAFLATLRAAASMHEAGEEEEGEEEGEGEEASTTSYAYPC